MEVVVKGMIMIKKYLVFFNRHAKNVLFLANCLLKRKRPKVLMLIDRPDWAFDISAKEIKRYLKSKYIFDLRYAVKNPIVCPRYYDLLYVFFWVETYYKRWNFDKESIIKEVASHRWQDNPMFGPCTPEEFVRRYLKDAACVSTLSLRLFNMIKPYHKRVFHTPNGYNPDLFFNYRKRQGDLVIGWAGNINDDVKGYYDIIIPACQNRCILKTASGKIPHAEMPGFYNSIDVLAVSSKHEAEPLTLIESMACGCFPVCADVGIVPELIEHKKNGYIVSERSPQAFSEAFDWCRQNLEFIREAGEENAKILPRKRSWPQVISTFDNLFLNALSRANRIRLRNHDVSYDSDINYFKTFCSIFRKYSLSQLHGVTLMGNTSRVYSKDGQPVEYDGHESIAVMPNDKIKQLAQGLYIGKRDDLIEYLNNSSHDEIALHGLFHTDYSRMSYAQQYADIQEGMRRLKELFPGKLVEYFIPPFNKYNTDTTRICDEFDLTLLNAEGVHLEAELAKLRFRPKIWYRYHHHRFYPSSTCRYHTLSLELLDKALLKAARDFYKKYAYLNKD